LPQIYCKSTRRPLLQPHPKNEDDQILSPNSFSSHESQVPSLKTPLVVFIYVVFSIPMDEIDKKNWIFHTANK
jgi:hypothetical protein